MSGAIVCKKIIPFFLLTHLEGLSIINACVTDSGDLITIDPLYLVVNDEKECREPWVPFVSVFPPYKGCAIKQTKIKVLYGGKVYYLEKGTSSNTSIPDH